MKRPEKIYKYYLKNKKMIMKIYYKNKNKHSKKKKKKLKLQNPSN